MKKTIKGLLFICIIMLFSLNAFAKGNKDAETETEQENKYGDWEVMTGYDKYGRENDDVQIYLTAEGTFSNSAATKEDLTVLVSADGKYADNGLMLMLAKYGTQPLSNMGKDEYYDVYIMDSEEEEHKLAGMMPSGSNILVVYGDKSSNWSYYDTEPEEIGRELTKIFEKGGTIYVNITNRDNKLEEYVFSFDCSGHDAIYDEYFGEE